MIRFSRRDMLVSAAALSLAPTIAGGAPAGKPKGEEMITRKIPSSGEVLPAIGMGTWQTFDVGASEEERAPLLEVLQRFFAGGGKLIDSSPMYGRAEAVVGDLLEKGDFDGRAFLATKVWTRGKEAGIAEMNESMRRMHTKRMDLMQVHNLLDADTHLATLREWKEQGRIRYVGITHYQLGAFDDIARRMKSGGIDFIQIPYSVGVREAENRLLPLAQERGIAVLIMRPFEGGSLFREARAKPLPPFAAELGATSWAQLFLKFILAHPAVTCAIPATSKPEHMSDNLQAMRGALPSDAQKRQMLQLLGG